MPYTEPDDQEIDEICDNAIEAAQNFVWPCSNICNPYDEKDPRHSIWASAFGRAAIRHH